MSYLVELTAPYRVGVRDYPDPAPGSGQVRVRTLYSGISAGTELTQYRGTNPHLDKTWEADLAFFVPGASGRGYPLDGWGYSEVGVVDTVGPDVSFLSEGDVVWGVWGHRSHAVLPAATLATHRLSERLDPIVGTFDRVGAVALNAVLAAQACPGEVVAVFGQGVIGLLTTQILASIGCQTLGIDTIGTRLRLAEQFGAIAFDARQGDLARAIRERVPAGVDRVIELSGTYPALHQAIRVAGPGGTVIAAGFYQGPANALVLGEEFHLNQVTLQSSQIGALPSHLKRRWTRERLHETVMTLCALGRLDPLPLVSHIIDAHQAPQAYALLDDPPADLLQVILDFGGTE